MEFRLYVLNNIVNQERRMLVMEEACCIHLVRFNFHDSILVIINIRKKILFRIENVSFWLNFKMYLILIITFKEKNILGKVE